MKALSSDFYDIHGRKKSLERQKEYFSRLKMPPRNRRLIEEYVQKKTLDDNLSVGRQEKIYSVMRVIGEFTKKPFSKLNGEDLVNSWRRISNLKIRRWRKVKGGMQLVDTGRPLSLNTKYTYGVIFVGFWRWLLNKKKIIKRGGARLEMIGVLEEEVKKKLPKKSKLVKAPRRTDLLTWSEACQLANISGDDMYRALIPVLYDSGCSIIEVLTLRCSNVEFIHNNSAAYLKIQRGKNEERIRDVLIIDSVPALLSWYNKHPLRRKDPNAPLWLNRKKNSALRYSALLFNLKRWAKKIGLKKPVNTHNFRKSETSEDRYGLSDAEDKKRHGWTPDSDMLRIYKNVDLKKADEKMLQTRGLVKPEDTDKEGEEGAVCWFCKARNQPGTEDCIVCGRSLDKKKILKDIRRMELFETLDSEKFREYLRLFEKWKKAGGKL